MVDTFFQAHLFGRAVGREGRCTQAPLERACSVSAPLGLPLLAEHTTQALRCSAGNHLRPALGCMHLPSLSRQARCSGSPLRHRFGWASQVQVAQGFGEHGRCTLSPFLSLLLSFLGISVVSLLWWMMTVQNPQKS